MYKYILSISVSLLLIFIYSQNTYSQINKSKIKADISVIPAFMYAGQSYDFAVTVKNVSRRLWYPDDLFLRFSGGFKVQLLSKPVILKPGEKTKIVINVTAPKNPDVYLFGLVISNNGEDVESSSVMVDVQQPPWTTSY